MARALGGRTRARRTPPPRGWYLPDVAAGAAELDHVAVVEGPVREDGPPVEVLKGVSRPDGRVTSWPVAGPVTAEIVTESLSEREVVTRATAWPSE